MSAPKPRILVSNDDGYFSEGLKALVEAVSPLGEVWVVAPDREQSAASHAISLHRPLRIKEVRERWYSVDGTPADSAYLAINHILKDARPTLMVSGINHGANLAEDVMYSGTVAAAMEGALLGVPAIAFSLVTRGQPFDFGPAARFARSLVQSALTRPLPPRMLLNVNIPNGVEPDGYVVTRLGRHTYGYNVVEKEDPRGRKYYWIGGSEYQHEDIPGSDCNAVFLDRRVSVTPLHFELTDHERLPDIKEWRLDGFQRHESDGA
ncbi:5'/3'-nucleotidase SurE [Pyxidicoccus fallax]|uniref:5'-nucleotidase SurE n=1 Tax=Pyxidicoccus fallax TaxID=394095 RepID=A0A848L5X2_9BACT|nr:5'/3'-nucleotidase SurE [Pyxidicoccus fallax]NPC78108.1 5'/3'-nucleotidase SurE [Pyxidicoccus fallax]